MSEVTQATVDDVQGYVATVPPDCDRIVWRGSFYSLDEIARTNSHAELVEALREIAEAMEYAAGCWAGSPMAVAYTRARSLVSLYGEGGK